MMNKMVILKIMELQKEKA